METEGKVQETVTNLLEELEPQKIYPLKESKAMLASVHIREQFLNSLYYFDIDYGMNVVRGIHLIQLLKEKYQNKKEEET